MQIDNLTDKPLWLRLNSGDALVIGPRSRSAPVPEHDVDDNAALSNLCAQGVIVRVQHAVPEPAAPPSRRKERSE